jgi:glycerol uptake facilitator protein
MFLGEFLGTMMLVFLGDSVVANVALKGTKGNGGGGGAGFTFVTLGWMVAVAVPVMVFGFMSGAHFNPAVTLGFAVLGLEAAPGVSTMSVLPFYIGAQILGGIIGGMLVYVMYRPHFAATDCKATKLGVFSTGPAIRSTADNLISETLATFTLVFCIIGALVAANPSDTIGGGLGIAWIILAMGTALGGTTGYALNPARDLGPRIAHAILPIPDKGDSDWGYSWIPVVGPLVGGAIAGVAGFAVFGGYIF